jgi:hypothetical protein
MKITISNGTKVSKQHRQQGVAVLVMLALLSLVLIYIGANTRAVYNLDREMKLLEQQQIRRLNATRAANAQATLFNATVTNTPPATVVNKAR